MRARLLKALGWTDTHTIGCGEPGSTRWVGASEWHWQGPSKPWKDLALMFGRNATGWLSHRTELLLRWIWTWTAPKKSGLVGKLLSLQGKSPCGRLGRRYSTLVALRLHELSARHGARVVGPDAIERVGSLDGFRKAHLRQHRCGCRLLARRTLTGRSAEQRSHHERESQPTEISRLEDPMSQHTRER
jgi:hypothetical protein